MPKSKKTKDNPYGLSVKQQATIQDMVEDVNSGRGLKPSKSHAKIYDTKNPTSMATYNLRNINFRMALLSQLKKNRIIGKNGKVEQRIIEGLDAMTTGKFGGEPDPKVRLAYIQEINKITGVYAPEKKQTATLKLTGNLTPEQLDAQIEKLNKELKINITP